MYRSKEFGGACEIKDPAAQKAAASIEKCPEDKGISTAIAADIATLWKCKGIRSTFENRSKFQLMDTSDYFFDHVERVRQRSGDDRDQGCEVGDQAHDER